MKQTTTLKSCFAILALQLCLLQAASHAESLSNSDNKIEIAYYEEIKDLPNHPEKLLIDVRTPEELIQTGKIPTSINIPLSVLEQELSLNVKAEDFKQKYGRDKPAADMPLIFTCRSGRRAQQAAEIAVQLGYTNVKNYKGSWLDWAEHEGLPKE
ncbi:rhodanese domain-containing protein CG4456-like [Lucilia sericata]|uniref:rhodanese domain-containing protein CG4456-like n=1 Tax=Lucilia sericata TaxID=13632 RepID=UPI0018A85C7F|nr:rhodanese domain-containing protein CG4456-like [Lucilia sericata]